MSKRTFALSALPWMLILLAVSLCPSNALAELPSEEDIARAVRVARQMARVPAYPAFMTYGTQGGFVTDPVEGAMKILKAAPGSDDAWLKSFVAAENLKQTNQELLSGLKLGAGVSLIVGLNRKNAIREAQLDGNKVVRITKEDTNSVGFLLEGHYFFAPDGRFLGIEKGMWGFGPFVAVQASDDSALTGVGFGLMLGLKQPSTSYVSGSSWNIGIGAIYDPSVKVLGDGLVANQPLPAGETTVRTKEVGGWGLMVMSSFNF